MWGIVKLYGFVSSQYDFLEQKGSCRQNRISVDMSYFLKIAVLSPILSPKGLSTTALVWSENAALFKRLVKINSILYYGIKGIV